MTDLTPALAFSLAFMASLGWGTAAIVVQTAAWAWEALLVNTFGDDDDAD